MANSVARIAGLAILILLFIFLIKKTMENFEGDTVLATETISAPGPSSLCTPQSYIKGFTTDGKKICLVCPSGYINDTLDPTKCQRSTANDTSSATAAAAAAAAAIAAATAAAAGNNSASNSTTSCPDNFTLSNGTCSECSGTQKSQGGITSCENLNCPANHKAVGHECVTCPSGTYSPGGISSSCTTCSAGMYINNGKCSECEPGKFSRTNGQTSCDSCAPGTYNNNSGSSVCTNCLSGKYQDAHGQTSCKTCLAGTYQSQTGQSNCISCPPGKYSDNDGSETCLRCPTGNYQDKSGQKSCIKCPKNTYSDTVGNESCKPCPSGSFTDDVGATSVRECLRPMTASNCVNIYNDSQLGFDKTTAPTGKSLYYGLTTDNFTLSRLSGTYDPSDLVSNNISKCVLNKRLEDRAAVCSSNREIETTSCGTAVTNSKSLLQAYEFVNAKGICVDKSGVPIPYPTLKPSGTTGSPDSILAHIVSCTNPQDAKTCSYNFPIGGVTHQTNPCTSRGLVYDFDKEDCVDPAVNTVDGETNNCKTYQAFDTVTGKCLDVITPIKSMPPNTKGTLVQGNYRDCKTTNMGDCTVVYKNKATDDTEYANTVNPCPTSASPSNTVYNFDTYRCEPPSRQAFMDYVTANKTNYRLEMPVIG
jgi:hypothetical protein